MKRANANSTSLSRRNFIAGAGGVGLAGLLGAANWPARADGFIELPFANGRRELVTNFPQKGAMILQRTRPPLLETPFEVFDQGVFTPNARFYVRWHLADIPTTIDPATVALKVHGHVGQPLSLTMHDLLHDFPPFEIAAVNQCSGNSLGLFSPRVAGGQWDNGAMGNALWRGVRLKDVLDRAGVTAGAIQVRFLGLDSGVVPQTPNFMKSLTVDHARDGEVMIAYEMNGEPLPLLNGFPLRLVVPGWYATYWVKMLADIEVLDQPDENYWTSKAYRIPDTPGANITPEQKDVKTVPINRMVPRSFVTNLKDGDAVRRGELLNVRGIAFGGDTGVAKVLVSADAGHRWQEARLGTNHGKYSFRQWQFPLRFAVGGPQSLKVRTVNTAGVTQPDHPNWNPGGYMLNVIETISLRVS
jgi:DMSO/TMAO reductase YedYZ molybdopterin-dependent catalytic subunit